MPDAGSTFANGMEHFALRMAVHASNTSNSETVGFKSSTPEAEDLFYVNLMRAGSRYASSNNVSAIGKQIGIGVTLSGVARNHLQGDLVASSDQYHFAINGKGYFRVELPDGTFGYKRAGNFKANAEGNQITTNEGYPLTPNITLPDNLVGNNITVKEDGTVSGKIQGQVEEQVLGEIKLYHFINDKGLDASGGNILIETTASGRPIEGVPGLDGVGVIKQNFLEKSNVNMVQEVADFIRISRAYEYCASGLKNYSDMQKAGTSVAA